MTKTKAFLQKHRWSLTGALLGALVFLVLYGVRVLDPVCVDWILNNPSPDPSQHYLGWVFYRRSGWHLPYLGANYSAIYPYRTSILYTDSIPLLAVVCKLLGGVLPARFQYLGLWGLFCYAMRAVWPRRSLPASAACARRIPQKTGPAYWAPGCWCCSRR